MHVLFLTYDFPYPTNSGGKARAFNMLKYAGSGIELSLFSFIREGFKQNQLQGVHDIGITDVTVFPRRSVRDLKNLAALFSNASIFKTLYYSAAAADRIGRIVAEQKVDIIHYESFYTAFYLSDHFRRLGVKQVYGSENIEFKLYEEYVRNNTPLPLKPLYGLQVRRIKAEELRMVREADMTFAVTESEQEFFQKHTDNPVRVVENGVPTDEFVYKARKTGETVTALFVGNFNYFPNKQAVEFLYTHVLKEIPDPSLRFVIIGKGAGQFGSLDSRIRTEEFVEDIKEAYYAADMFVSPVSIGGGTNFKVLEAMATGLPVITFADRVREIGARNGHEVLTAETGKDFRHAVEKLMTDRKLAEHIAENARKIIEEKYAWKAIGKRLHAAWEEVYEGH
jgi:glycosyltransferase involved in cell wall biosynthesis